MNYSDPTGNSLWSRIKGAAKKAAKKVVKTVVNTAKKVVKTVAKGVKAAAKWVKNAVSHPKQVIQKAKNTVKQKAKQASQKIVSSGSNFIRAVSKGGAILAGLGIATIVTGGAAGVIAAGAFSGALIGGGTGAVLGGLSSVANGDGFIQGAADGFLWGTIGGAVSGGVGAATGSLASSSASSIMKNPLAKSALENVADTAVGTIDDLAHGRDVSLGTVAKDFGTGMLFSGKEIADDWKKTTKESNFIKNVESNVSENKQMPMDLQFFASKKQETGSDVKWNNGWRTPDGKFASPKGTERAGGQAEEEVWDAISKKEGWGVRRGRIYTKDSTGQVRVYDGAAITPDGKYIGLEVKSGKAQREFDNRISRSNPAIGVGQSEGITISHSITIRR